MTRFEARLIPSKGESEAEGHHKVCYACFVVFCAEQGEARSPLTQSRKRRPEDPHGKPGLGGASFILLETSKAKQECLP